tara:strand:+ start:63128 stop:63931 length:804 start_codon:yes stop_codon:yes gene_type:complete
MDTLDDRHCDNCHATLLGDFCHHCGQEKKSYIRNISGVVTEFFGEFSNWDTRVWRTLFPLWFRPGFLSQRYVSGHRVPYVPPLRLYLFTSIIAFLLFSQLTPSDVMTIERAPDAPALEMNEQLQGLLDNPQPAITRFFRLAPQVMFVLLPTFALILKLLYLRSRRYYTEHLILALHNHSFILQMLAFYLGVTAVERMLGTHWLAAALSWLDTLIMCWIPAYLLLSQKRFYEQRWGKTLLKFCLTASLYSVLLLAAGSGLILFSVFSP